MPATIGAATRRVVLVEDSLAVRERLRDLIEITCAASVVAEAGSVAAARALMREHQPDALVLDVSLADGSGLTVLKDVKAQHPGCMVVMLTNFSDPFYRDACLTLGADYFFDKTTQFEQVLDVLGRRHPVTPRRARLQYGDLLQSIDGIVWEADATTLQFTFVSEHAREITGHAPERWLSDKDFWVRHLHPEDRDEAVRYCQAQTQRKEDHTFEYRLLTADGGVVWLRDIVTYVEEPGRTPVLRGIMVDITAQKEADCRIRKLNRMYRVLSEINQAVMRAGSRQDLFDAACRIATEQGEFRMAWVARRTSSSSGRMNLVAQRGASDETVALVRTLLAAERAEEGCTPSWQALATGEVAVCNDIATDPRAAHWRDAAMARGFRSMVALPLIMDGTPVGTFNMYASAPNRFDDEEIRLLRQLAADMSFGLEALDREARRREAEARLRESETRFRELTDHIQEVFYITDASKSRMLYVSPAYESIWGRSCATLYAAPRSWMDAVHPDDDSTVAGFDGPWDNRAVYEGEYRILRPDGEVRRIRDRAIPVRNADGVVERIVGVARDVTDRWRAEEQLRQAQRMESVGRLAAGIAHDFNNVLAVINSVAELVQSDLPEGSEAHQDLDTIREAGKKGANLTRQLLAFSRRQELHPVTLNLNTVLCESTQFLQRVLGKWIQVDVRPGDDLADVSVDRGQLEQVIMNLAVNARDAMPNGGDLRFQTENVVVSSGNDLPGTDLGAGRYVALSVADTGTGMSATTMQRIFEPFFTTKAEGVGTGLGLATVHGIIKQHGGDVVVRSTEGEGTTFTIYLPAIAS